MPVTQDQPAPYAPASAILEIIERHRNKGLPPVVDSDVLARGGISASLIPRTLQALKSLDLLDEDGRPSEVFEGLRLAPTAEYQQRLAEWLNAAYADALSFVDPATDDEVAIRDAFRTYKPTGQQGRMVTLFTGLFKAAGVMPERAKQGGAPKPRGSASKAGKSPVGQTARHPPNPAQPRQQGNSFHSATALPAAISGLLATLPEEGGYWTQERRDQFYATFGVVLDYVYKIGEPPKEETAANDESAAA